MLSLFPFLKSTFNLLWTFPSVSAVWGDFLLCQLTVSHIAAARYWGCFCNFSNQGKGTGVSYQTSLLVGSLFFPVHSKPHSYKVCSPASEFPMMLQKTGKPVSYFSEWKWRLKKIHLCSEWIIYLGNPCPRGGLSFEPHFGDVFSEANGNDKSASSGIQYVASRM